MLFHLNMKFLQTAKSMGEFHRYQKYLNRLLKVCYVPTTSTLLIAFFSFLLLWPLTVLMKPTRQPVYAVKQSIYLDVYGEFDLSRAYTLAKLECF